jgi:hypothetical protein
MSVRPSVSPNVSGRLPLDGISWNLTLGISIELCWEKPNLIKVGQKTWGTLHEDLSMCYCYLQHAIAIKAVSSTEMLSCCPSVLPCVCPSVRMYQHGSHWKDFHKTWYWDFLWKIVEKCQMRLESDEYIKHFTWRPYYITLACDIKSPQKRSLRVKWCKAVRIYGEVQTLRERGTMLRYAHNAYLVQMVICFL